MHRLHLLLTLCYPPAVHLSLLASHSDWALIVLALVSFSHLLISSHGEHGRVTTMAPALVLLLSLYGLWQETPLALYLPPVLISGSLLWLFARSLKEGREPLITALARQVFGEQDEEVLRYTRRVTQLWSLFFLAILLESLLLALLAPIELWSLFTNLLNYLFTALLFFAEFGYRRLRYRQRTSLTEFYHSLTNTDWPALTRGDKP